MKFLSIFVLSFFITGCAATLSESGKKVRILKGSPEYLKECTFIGVVDQTHYAGWNPNDNKLQALNEARNEAALMGGDMISIVGEYWRGVQADVFNCNERNT